MQSRTPADERRGHNVRWRKARGWVGGQVKSSCTPAAIKRRLPILGYVKGYSLDHLQCDLIAGLTVGLTVIPQGIAYASVAGLPLQYGLYTGFIGCLVYAFLGSTLQLNIGPTAIIGLLTAQVVKDKNPDYAVLLTFISGIVQLGFVVCNLGFLIDFISVPVVSGFTSAAALIISSTQLKGLLGLKFNEERFIFVIYQVFAQIMETNIPDLIMGVSCMVILLSLRKLGFVKWDKNDLPNQPPTLFTRAWRKTIWLVCTGRNALVVIAAALIAYLMSTYGISVLTLTGSVKAGFPEFKPPPFQTVVNNETVYFPQIISDMGTSMIIVPLVSILEHVAIAKAFAQGKCVDAKQELLALGMANVFGSFVSAFPLTGSFSRTALNRSCGIKTPLGGLFTGGLVLLALGFLATSFKFIPKACLSAVIISALIFVIEYEMIPHLWRTKKLELCIMLLTFGFCLGLGVEYGILIGILFSILYLLYTLARPSIQIERVKNHEVEFIHVQPDQNLFFPAVEYLRLRIRKAANSDVNIPIVFDGSRISTTDYTVAQGIKQILDDFRSRKQKIVFTNIKPDILDLLHHLDAEAIPNLSSLDELNSVVREESNRTTVEINNSSRDSQSHNPDIEHLEPINDTATEAIASDTYSEEGKWKNEATLGLLSIDNENEASTSIDFGGQSEDYNLVNRDNSNTKM